MSSWEGKVATLAGGLKLCSHADVAEVLGPKL